ncbi:MAG: hypothetical protein H6748_07865 [Spirochaetaceae bacterium]|nr:hypothetical protein [Myxococcales bacterium]MCB9723943.1 hypothetical protein [Spirochaetaceae bacterium]HPG24526.1 hypothetical protein [Myxococcota bacterium]
MKLELARVERLNLGLSAGAVAASLALETPHFATSLAAGALLEAINLGAIHRGAKRFFSGEIAGARGWIGVFSLRFLVLATAIFLTMHAGANPAALLIGLSIVMPATLIDAWLNRPPVVDPATLPTFLDGAPLAGESEEDAAYWESYSVWRPGRLLTTQRDDLIAEEATRVAAEEKAHWARLEAARTEANARHSRANLPEEMPEDGSDEAR